MWVARNNWGKDDFYVLCAHRPETMVSTDGQNRSHVDNSGVTYAKMTPWLFEALHPEAKLSPGAGPTWVGLRHQECPTDVRLHPAILTEDTTDLVRPKDLVVEARSQNGMHNVTAVVSVDGGPEERMKFSVPQKHLRVGKATVFLSGWFARRTEIELADRERRLGREVGVLRFVEATQ